MDALYGGLTENREKIQKTIVNRIFFCYNIKRLIDREGDHARENAKNTAPRAVEALPCGGGDPFT